MDDKRRISPPPTEFAPGELNAFLNEGAGPTREDDTPVLMGQSGPRRRATPEELRAFLKEHLRRQAVEG